MRDLWVVGVEGYVVEEVRDVVGWYVGIDLCGGNVVMWEIGLDERDVGWDLEVEGWEGVGGRVKGDFVGYGWWGEGGLEWWLEDVVVEMVKDKWVGGLWEEWIGLMSDGVMEYLFGFVDRGGKEDGGVGVWLYVVGGEVCDVGVCEWGKRGEKKRFFEEVVVRGCLGKGYELVLGEMVGDGGNGVDGV